MKNQIIDRDVKQLLALKKSRKWTYDELAVASGLKRSSLEHWLRGYNIPRADLRVRLREFLEREK